MSHSMDYQGFAMFLSAFFVPCILFCALSFLTRGFKRLFGR